MRKNRYPILSGKVKPSKPACRNGHLYTEESTGYANGFTSYYCKTCQQNRLIVKRLAAGVKPRRKDK